MANDPKINKQATKGLNQAIETTGFSGEKGQVVQYHGLTGTDVQHIFVLGLGQKSTADDLSLQSSGAAIKKLIQQYNNDNKKKIKNYIIAAAHLQSRQNKNHVATQICLGSNLSEYKFDRYKTKKSPPFPEGYFSVKDKDEKSLARSFKRANALVDGVNWAKDVSNEPPDVLTPEIFANRISLALPGKTKVYREDEMKSRGMFAHLGVGQGSVNGSCVVIAEHFGHPNPDEKPVVLVGKGITFDTGGNSIKTGTGMIGMKFDMCGAAAAMGLMKVLVDRDAKANVVAIVGLAENMPGSDAIRPDDILTSMSGKTIEVKNTDAEGRLVLADCLTLAQQEYQPKVLIDAATLTGAVRRAIDKKAGLFAREKSTEEALIAAAAATGEEVWPLPFGGIYRKAMNSQVADIANMGDGSCLAGASTAASFLEEFVDEGQDWVHLDIASVASAKNMATGFGVRLLDRYIRDNHEGKPKSAPKPKRKKSATKKSATMKRQR